MRLQAPLETRIQIHKNIHLLTEEVQKQILYQFEKFSNPKAKVMYTHMATKTHIYAPNDYADGVCQEHHYIWVQQYRLLDAMNAYIFLELHLRLSASEINHTYGSGQT